MRIAFLLSFISQFAPSLNALPQYAARSARVCDNCHLSPFATSGQQAWVNPTVAERKCNMSCQSCHINPAGGMLRRAPGRYYTRSTLPMFFSARRPYHDQQKPREVLSLFSYFREENGSSANAKRNSPQENMGSLRVAVFDEQGELQRQGEGLKVQPARYEVLDVKEGNEFFHIGLPWGIASRYDQSVHAHEIGRYGEIEAAPLISVGGNFRFATITNDKTYVFPMQADLGLAIQPVEHLTLSATAGAQGSKSDEENQGRYKVQNAFVLLHDFPYQSYLQAGLFLPEFGLRHDDHTAYGREYFEMNNAYSDYDITGIQVGLAPNYAHASSAIFYTVDNKRQQTGWGFTANIGWRDIAWGVGTSIMTKKRAPNKGGNLDAVSVYGYYNLWHAFPAMRYSNPLVLLSELNVGKRSNLVTADVTFATYQLQLEYLIFNGLNLRSYAMYLVPDYTDPTNFKERLGIGFDWHLVRHCRLTADIRFETPREFQRAAEFVTFIHLYF